MKHKFTIHNISKRLNKINIKIGLENQATFPSLYLLSSYSFEKKFVKIYDNGDIDGGFCKMLTSLIDFSFVRSLVAHTYSIWGRPCYDPVSLFLLDIFRYIDGYKHMKQILSILRDKDRGRAYRTYTGLSMHDLPCEATISNFHARLGPELYNEIFQILIQIFHQLEMITFKVLAHDGTLFDTWARYKGCPYFCDDCKSITVENVMEKVQERVNYRLDNMAKNNLGSEFRVYTECPSERFTDDEDVKKPKIELFAFKLAFNDGKLSKEEENTEILLGVHDQLQKHNLKLQSIRSNACCVDAMTGNFTFSCPKLPKDTDARIGVRRDPQNSNKKQKIFGYNAVITTSVELELTLELPVAVTNIAGNADEGKQIIVNKKKIQEAHNVKAQVDIADAKYDTIENYEFIRANGSIPIIDYNIRKEKLSKKDMLERGYDQNGWPFAPCNLLTRPNGFDEDRQRLTFCCFKHCKKLKHTALKELNENYDLAKCPYKDNATGYTAHMSLEEYPRLANEIPRGSKRYNELKKIRSASERANATLKEDLGILVKPRTIGIFRSSILVHIATIVLLLIRALRFIVNTTLEIRDEQSDQPDKEKKKKPKSPSKSLLNLIQLE